MTSQDLCSLSSQQHIQTSNQQHNFSFFPILFIYFALGPAQELNGLTLTQPVLIGHDKLTRIWLESEPPNTNCLQHLGLSMSSPMHKISAVSKDHKQVDPLAAVYDHQAFATNRIIHQQEQEVFPGHLCIGFSTKRGHVSGWEKPGCLLGARGTSGCFITIPMSNGAQNSGTLCCFLTLTEFSTATSNFQAKNNLVT
jgi:hypothetical protein